MYSTSSRDAPGVINALILEHIIRFDRNSFSAHLQHLILQKTCSIIITQSNLSL